MNDESFEGKLSEMRELYQENKDVATKHMNICIRGTKNEISDIKNNKKLSKPEKMWLWGVIIVIMLAGLLNFSQYYMYFFGALFFFSGHFVALKVRGFGLVFLFSHSITGMCLMVASQLNLYDGEVFVPSALLSDISQNALIYVGGAALAFIVATVLVIVYNISNKVKEMDHSFLYPITIYAVGFIMACLFTRVMFLI